jgi:hypothetical protein
MTIRLLSWGLLFAGVISFAYHWQVRRRYRALGAPLPSAFAGDLAGDVSFVLLSIALVINSNGPIGIVLPLGAIVVLGVAVTQWVRARRRDVSPPAI